MASLSKTPPTIQQGLSMVGSIWGPQGELLAKSFLMAHGYPTQGGITPALAQDIASSLGYHGASIPSSSGSRNSQNRGSSSGTSIGVQYSAHVLPAQFPNPANLTPVAEPSLSSPAAGLQGEFTPTVKTIDGRPVLKAFHMIATSYGPSLADNYPYGPTDAFGQPLQNGMIAVDPSVIPLHTVLYVTGYHDNYLPSGGFLGQAMDTGGAIKGDRVDLFINANENVINDFGVQQVTVYELGN
jgi:3D (Asp-Asp-Asp) domain-containing protein